jgi:hypothetical protein
VARSRGARRPRRPSSHVVNRSSVPLALSCPTTKTEPRENAIHDPRSPKGETDRRVGVCVLSARKRLFTINQRNMPMNETDPSSSSPSSNVILLRPESSSLPSSSPQASNDVPLWDESQPDAAAEQGADDAPSNDLLPTIFLDRDFHVVLDDAMRAMATDPLLFAKGDQLVRILVDGDSPRLLALGGAQLREVLSSCARWIKEDPVLDLRFHDVGFLFSLSQTEVQQPFQGARFIKVRVGSRKRSKRREAPCPWGRLPKARRGDAETMDPYPPGALPSGPQSGPATSCWPRSPCGSIASGLSSPWPPA